MWIHCNAGRDQCLTSVTASGACPRKGAFAASLASATENFVLRRTIFHHLFPLFCLWLCCIPTGNVSGEPCGGTGDTALGGDMLGDRHRVASEGGRGKTSLSMGDEDPMALHSEVPKCLGTSLPV